LMMFNQMDIVLIQLWTCPPGSYTTNNGTSKNNVCPALETKQGDPQKTSVVAKKKFLKHNPHLQTPVKQSKLLASLFVHSIWCSLLFTRWPYTMFYLASSSRLRNPVVRSSYSFWNFATKTSSPSAGSSNF